MLKATYTLPPTSSLHATLLAAMGRGEGKKEGSIVCIYEGEGVDVYSRARERVQSRNLTQMVQHVNWIGAGGEFRG